MNVLLSENKRRTYLGITVSQNQNLLSKNKLGKIDVTDINGVTLVNNEFLGNDFLNDSNRWKLLRRSKLLLSMRSVSQNLIDKLDYRQDWNLDRPVQTVLDLFPSLKFAYTSLCGRRMNGVVSVTSNTNKVRIDDIARSHSIRLDPVEAPKILFKYKQRIQKIISWAYSNNLVPVMMTLTVFHRWNDLSSLCQILSKAWSELFRGPAGLKRKAYIGLRGYIRRMEETFNDGDDKFDESLNSGWHPHYHVILIVPRENLTLLSDYEITLRKVWVSLVCKYYRKILGENFPSSYLKSFEKHGLFFSRVHSTGHALFCDISNKKSDVLFEVKDGKYLAKIMGTEAPLYGVDSELTSLNKRSKTPFALLKGKVTANLADLWCEYALATKKIPCFTFSRGLQSEVDNFFADSLDSSPFLQNCLDEINFTLKLREEDYRWLYRHFEIDNFIAAAKKGYEFVKAWLKNSFNIDLIEDRSDAITFLRQSSIETKTQTSAFLSLSFFKLYQDIPSCNFFLKKHLTNFHLFSDNFLNYNLKYPP